MFRVDEHAVLANPPQPGALADFPFEERGRVTGGSPLEGQADLGDDEFGQGAGPRPEQVVIIIAHGIGGDVAAQRIIRWRKWWRVQTAQDNDGPAGWQQPVWIGARAAGALGSEVGHPAVPSGLQPSIVGCHVRWRLRGGEAAQVETQLAGVSTDLRLKAERDVFSHVVLPGHPIDPSVPARIPFYVREPLSRLWQRGEDNLLVQVGISWVSAFPMAGKRALGGLTQVPEESKGPLAA